MINGLNAKGLKRMQKIPAFLSITANRHTITEDGVIAREKVTRNL